MSVQKNSAREQNPEQYYKSHGRYEIKNMHTIDKEKLEGMLMRVQRPGRYLGNEWNVVRKDLDGVDVKFALAFPDIYDVGMSYLGLRIIYGVLNERKDVACERVFAPWPDFEELLRKEGVPLFSLESRVPIKDFDILGFSFTYELNYTNVLNMLSLAGIPLRSSGRDEGFPLVIAGGPAAFNPHPMSEFIDAFMIGDGEEAVLEIVDAYKRGQREGKRGLLKELSNIEGVYVPSFPKEIKKRIVKNLDKAFYPTREMVPNIQVIHDRITLEVMRGCPFACKFCQASSFYRPMRVRTPQKILELAKEIYRNTGYEEISLLSLSSGDYPDVVSLIAGLINEFQASGVGISLPSLRSDDVLRRLPAIIARVRRSGLTFAPEAGTERLRRIINKNIDTEKIILACEEAFRSGWRLVKFYFMIGLPTETYEDLGAIQVFLSRVLNLKKAINISVSVSNFVPKLHTPFENENMDNLNTLADKQRFLKERLRHRRVRMRFHDPRVSILEAALNRPDKNIGEAVYEAWSKKARLDSWREYFNFDIWAAAFKNLATPLDLTANT